MTFVCTTVLAALTMHNSKWFCSYTLQLLCACRAVNCDSDPFICLLFEYDTTRRHTPPPPITLLQLIRFAYAPKKKLYHTEKKKSFSLIVEYDVRLPDFVDGQPEALDAPEVGVVPAEVGVPPYLCQPTVHGQHLVLLVDVDNVMDRHVEGDVDRRRGVLGRPHARLVVAE